jgi:general secretion pathway protein B
MSLILDALRKSENQRQRESGPALAVVPEAVERRGPAPWMWILGALLGLNIVVLAALLLFDASPEPAARARAAPAEGSAPLAARRIEPIPLALPARRPAGEVRPLAVELSPAPQTAPATPASAGSTAPEPAVPDRPADRPAAPPAARQGDDPDARLPSFNELVVKGQLNVPAMHLDIHVYSDDPAERFVFLNMRKYREGDDTREGPQVERIAVDGVVMSHEGRRFVLPRE